MRVVVTGGAGYIGSVVTGCLRGRGHEVVIVDNFSRGHRDVVPPAVHVVEADLADTARLVETFRAHHIDAVVHMAAFALVGESVADPALYYRNNVVGGLSLLEAMLRADVSRLVFSSTCAVYGEPRQLPLEETHPQEPTNPYGETKLVLERALRAHASAYGLRSVSLRYFNAAGAVPGLRERHDPETHLIPIVLQVAAGLRSHVTIHGTDYPTRDGTCVRDYVHVQDLAEAHGLALDRLAGAAQGTEAYNLGCGGEGHTVREVIETVRRVTGRAVEAREGPRRPGDPAVLVASSAKARNTLGWTPGHESLQSIVDSAWQAVVEDSAES